MTEQVQDSPTAIDVVKLAAGVAILVAIVSSPAAAERVRTRVRCDCVTSATQAALPRCL